ncbi:hypothetical protein GCM10007049_28730 [Echinicola pacifica]|uniref:DUF4127 family protein n=1 Tax=Echinicola pacifica TaxID=346377 RepID=A0A918Q4C4_9BACT|nr:DUF4127 family protein [Echinicola pacifica]GGZ33333.1 hypothetical protein GCM10007049_28730 [Echinicola pacifica]
MVWTRVKRLVGLIMLLGTTTGFFAQAQEVKNILLIPLDNRPPCLQFPVHMASIAGLNVLSPPDSLLGNLQDAGQPERIAQWVLEQDLSEFHGLIVVGDMLAYGGLVASRKPDKSLSEALSNLSLIDFLHKEYPELPLYAQSVIMRLAPTADGSNEAYRENLAEWASLQGNNSDSAKMREEILLNLIPKPQLEDYINARKRNHLVNMRMLDLVREGKINYLILSQDDAKPQGIHKREQTQLNKLTKMWDLKDQVVQQAGTDEVAMLLLARLANKINNTTPGIQVHYSSEQMSEQVMPFEDQSLKRTVNEFIKSTGSVRQDGSTQADLHFYIYTSRADEQETEYFIKAIAKGIKKGQHIILADIDPVGDTQGGGELLSEALVEKRLLLELEGYASWNTAGNTLGTALPQGVLNRIAREKGFAEMEYYQDWFLIHRYLNDYVYNHLVRKSYSTALGPDHRNASILDSMTEKKAVSIGIEDLRPYQELLNRLLGEDHDKRYHIDSLDLSLPWHRAFEAEIDFDLIDDFTIGGL